MYGLRGLNINLTGETLCGGFGSKWRCKAEIKRKIILRNNLRQDFVTCCPPQPFRARGHPSSSPEPRPHSATPQTLRERCPEQRGRFKGLQGARMTRAGEQDVERGRALQRRQFAQFLVITVAERAQICGAHSAGN